MYKTEKILSIIGLVIQGLGLVLLLLFLIANFAGVTNPEVTTTVNGEVHVQSVEAARNTFTIGLSIGLVLLFVSELLGFIAFRKIGKDNKVSGILHIIAGVLMFNLVGFVVWLVAGILMLKQSNRTNHKEVVQ
ncbi:DUF4064 domain-containing protein [Staphylococcus sp. IVB6181]|uniref:DUF4064 domain-containing protein n=1 Tax=Staphylococcus sp. IVB6181 TaxID=2929481 RepID=UPI0021D3B5BB|nr:DUF4064 domain-containing protein [Staphylococcus sp. IVB6181]UXV34848.1 DUF4064 domain-containing protein [Staphylococcus sp. IVB6181]